MNNTNTSIDVLVIGAGPGGLAIAAALGQEKLSVGVLTVNNHDEPSQILVIGEEDLATLPAIVLAPLKSSIIYCQPDLGMVHILVTTDAKRDAWDLLSQFDGDLDSVFSTIAQSDL